MGNFLDFSIASLNPSVLEEPVMRPVTFEPEIVWAALRALRVAELSLPFLCSMKTRVQMLELE